MARIPMAERWQNAPAITLSQSPKSARWKRARITRRGTDGAHRDVRASRKHICSRRRQELITNLLIAVTMQLHAVATSPRANRPLSSALWLYTSKKCAILIGREKEREKAWCNRMHNTMGLNIAIRRREYRDISRPYRGKQMRAAGFYLERISSKAPAETSAAFASCREKRDRPIANPGSILTIKIIVVHLDDASN